MTRGPFGLQTIVESSQASRVCLAMVWGVALLAASCDRIATPPKPPFQLITLDRSACFGQCPDYRLSISSAGRVEYLGRGSVKVTGQQTGIVQAAELALLADAFREVGFSAMRDHYTSREDGCPSVLTDGPTVVVVLETSLDGRITRKSVLHDHGCRTVGQYGNAYPYKLAALEDRIDAIVGSSRWTGHQQANVPLFLVFPSRDTWPERP
jgi:hypothetical protein